MNVSMFDDRCNVTKNLVECCNTPSTWINVAMYAMLEWLCSMSQCGITIYLCDKVT